MNEENFAPLPEDGDGIVIPDRTGPPPAEAREVPVRGPVSAADLAARSMACADAALATSPMHAELASLAPHLNGAEVVVPADGLDVRLGYRAWRASSCTGGG